MVIQKTVDMTKTNVKMAVSRFNELTPEERKQMFFTDGFRYLSMAYDVLVASLEADDPAHGTLSIVYQVQEDGSLIQCCPDYIF